MSDALDSPEDNPDGIHPSLEDPRDDTGDFDHRLTPEGRAGFLAAIGYITLIGQTLVDPEERATIAALIRALKRKADSEYLIGRPSEGAQGAAS